MDLQFLLVGLGAAALLLTLTRLTYNFGWEAAFKDRTKAHERLEQASNRCKELADERRELRSEMRVLQERHQAADNMRLRLVRESKAQAALLAAATVDRRNLHQACFDIAKRVEGWVGYHEREIRSAMSIPRTSLDGAWVELIRKGMGMDEHGSGFIDESYPACLRSKDDFGPEPIEESRREAEDLS